jgi:hypothetical protein
MRRREQRKIARPIHHQNSEVIDASIGACSNKTSAPLYSKCPLKKMPRIDLQMQVNHEKHERHEIESFRAFCAYRVRLIP